MLFTIFTVDSQEVRHMRASANLRDCTVRSASKGRPFAFPLLSTQQAPI